MGNIPTGLEKLNSDIEKLEGKLDRRKAELQTKFEVEVSKLKELYSALAQLEKAERVLRHEKEFQIRDGDATSTAISIGTVRQVVEGMNTSWGWQEPTPEELATKIGEITAQMEKSEVGRRAGRTEIDLFPEPAGPLVRFYSGENDSRGRTLDEILKWGDFELEKVHDYIQWLFPLKTASQFVLDAPLLDDKQIAAFQEDEKLKQRVLEAFKRMLGFYGFGYGENHARNRPVIGPSELFEKRQWQWLEPGNHNYRRISRILSSLRLLGLPEQALAFYYALRELYYSPGISKLISQETFKHWTKASGYKRLSTGRKQLILEVGVEGGGASLYGTRTPLGDWIFFTEGSSMGLDDNDDEYWSNWTSEKVSTLEEGLKLVYPDSGWVLFHPMEVHPEFRRAIWKVVEAKVKNFQKHELEAWEYVKHDWRQRCGYLVQTRW